MLPPGLFNLQDGGGVNVLHVVQGFERVDEFLHFDGIVAAQDGFVLCAHSFRRKKTNMVWQAYIAVCRKLTR